MKTQRLAVTLEQPGTDDLKEYQIRVDNRDHVRRELISARKSFPPAQAAPLLTVAVTAYAALLRAGEIPTTETVEKFLERCVDARFVNEDGSPVTAAQLEAGDAGADAVDPSQPGVEPGY